jgi:DNA polymerase III sliding clamp (beta) subunit (PCNA family)
MDIQVLKFRSALGLLDSVIPRKSKKTPEILANVHLKNGQIIATDSMKAVAIEMPELQGECLLPYDEVTKLLRYVPGSETLHIEQDHGRIRLAWESGKAAYDAQPIEDYPALPQLVDVLIKQTVNGEHLVTGLLSVADYCAPESDKRPVLQGVMVLLGDQIEVVASDGYRLAAQKLPLSIPSVNDNTRSVIIPQETVYLLGELWKKAPRNNRSAGNVVDLVLPRLEMDLEVDASKIKVHFGIVSLYGKRIEGTPPNYQQLVPDYEPTVQVYGPDLELALRRIQVSATEKRAALRMVWDAGIMTLSDIMGNIESKFPAQTFSAGKYAVEVAFIQEYIRGKSGLVTICTKDHKSPMLLRHLNSPTVVLMPRIVSWPDEPPPEEGVAVAAGNGPSSEAAKDSPDEEEETSEGDGKGAPEEEEAETPAT